MDFRLWTLDWLGCGGERDDEPISPAGDGLDEAWRFGVLPQHVAQVADIGVEQSRAHTSLGLRGFEEFLLGHQPVGVLGQVAQDGEGFRSEGKNLVPLPELLSRAVQGKGGKVNDGFRFHASNPLSDPPSIRFKPNACDRGQ